MNAPGPMEAPPEDLNAEATTLGAMMHTKAALVHGLANTAEDDYRFAAHRMIYAAIADLYADSEIVDTTTVIARLQRRNQLEDVHGPEFVKKLFALVDGAGAVKQSARIVHELARLRRMIRACDEMMRDAYTYEGNAEDLLRKHLGALREIAGDCSDERTAQHTSATIDALHQRIQRQRKRKGEVSAAQFGIETIDRGLGGLEDWGMIVLRGDTKRGKSLLSGQAAIATALHIFRDDNDERVVLAYVLEAIEEWEERALAWLGHIDKRYLEGRKIMGGGEESRYDMAMRAWANLPLYRTDRLTHVDEIMLDVEQHVMQGHQPALIIVDHFQRLSGEGETATLRYDDAARKLAQIPRAYKCPLIVPSQVTVANGQKQSMWARRLDQEATVVFDIEADSEQPSLRLLKPSLPRRYVPFTEGKYFIGPNFDARLLDEDTWLNLSAEERARQYDP